MSVQQKQQQEKLKILCGDCGLFYGSSATSGLCSVCHKKNKDVKKEESPQATIQEEVLRKEESLFDQLNLKTMPLPSAQPTKEEETPAEIDRSRCSACNRKIGLLGVQCRCTRIFCNKHRLPENHQCHFDHLKSGRELLKKDNFKVCNAKIRNI